MNSLNGNVAIITGASSGIGYATALAIADKGGKVVVAARREDRLNELTEKIKTVGGHVLAIPCDVTDWSQVEALAHKTLAAYGRIDTLVANAGVAIMGPLLDGNPRDWKRAFEINVLGVLYSIKAAVPHMLEHEKGDVILLSSIAGRVANSPFGVYAATKYAVNAIGETLRKEIGKKGIRVTLVEPGGVTTEFIASAIDNLAPGQESPFDRASFTRMQPEDIARAIVYVLEQPPNVSVNEIMIKPVHQV
jgi:NADP-dependent 3-hydroxy acid dehydrogenase YdfG